MAADDVDETGSPLTLPRSESEHGRRRRRRLWIVGTAAVVAAVVIGTGVVFLLGKGSSPPTWLLLEKNVADCHSGASLTPPCELETMSLSGGSMRTIPIDPDANPWQNDEANYIAVGHRLLVVPSGPDAFIRNQTPLSMGVTGLDVLDLRTGAWTQVSLSEETTINIGSDFTSAMMLDPAEDAVAIDTGDGSDIAIVSLATGSVRQLSPRVANVDLIAWLSDGIHVVADCPGETSWSYAGGGEAAGCGYAIDPSSGTASRRAAEDLSETGGGPQIVSSADGIHEAVLPARSGNDILGGEILAGTAGSSLRAVYTAPSGDFLDLVAVGDDGSVLVEEGRTPLGLNSIRAVLVVGGSATTIATFPAGGGGDGSAVSCSWGPLPLTCPSSFPLEASSKRGRPDGS
jgi:hypothetical protein